MRMPFIFRQSLRRLTHDRRFALTTIVTLGLAIAANTVIFGAAYTVLWRPLPMANAERLLTLWNGYPGHPEKAAVAVQEYFEYRDQLETFDLDLSSGPHDHPPRSGGRDQSLIASP
jgi:hypothetical protein